ncbi:uncharacterized protein BDW43DRAFT_6443 [Aspergillus alliaceus]|uniref:uncharacterized protein n=1 Tax=Petromyces alliaceus TaxID=209559 RepID=UPI0012A5A4DA|nr:uncharacterized protein BDW43DRAFT_6443 [Aspergillus alliaceus]KAB8239495.1 hypothetical protein BDW43DRAFT_6443 [Aspergillus alliaceus]
MYRRLSLPLWLKPRQNLPLQLPQSQALVRHASADAKRVAPHFYESTPSQLLRFALTGTTKQAGGLEGDSRIDQHLLELFSEPWPSNTPPPPPLWNFVQRGTSGSDRKRWRVLRNLSRLRGLEQLHVWIEKNVNDECGSTLLQSEGCKNLAQVLERSQRYSSYAEILSTINGVITRLEKLRVPISGSLFTLGMYYSCCAFSAPSLKRHIESYLILGPRRLDPESCGTLVSALLVSLRLLSFREPGHDTSEMLNIITGENAGGHRSEYNLHSIMCWADHQDSTQPIGQYLSLLARLKSDRILQELWDQMMKGLGPGSPHVFQSAYDCVKALIDVGSHTKAIFYLKQISKSANGNLPGLSKFQDLRGLLAARGMAEALPQLAGTESLSILEAQLEDMEKRLGVTWNRQRSLHTSIANPLCISSERPLLTIDGDSTGYDSNVRLIAEIEAIGCSKSMLELGKIATLLDECEGGQIHVSISSQEAAHYDFFWFPQRSTIEFPDNHTLVERRPNEPWSPSNLGLLRVRPHSNRASLVIECSLHLMQLGYLVARPKLTDEAGSKPARGWEETGHIVAWDRAFGRFVIVYVGESRRSLDTRKQWVVPDLPFGLNAVMKISPEKYPLEQNGVDPPFPGDGTRYCIDVDPGLDLVF